MFQPPACCLVLLLFAGFCAQEAKEPSFKTSDAQYRKLDEDLAFLRARNAAQFAIKAPKGIDEAVFVTLGGIEQWVTVRGQDRSNPVLLFLHGGPGDVTTSWSFALFAPWEQVFTVAQWDERGSGRTFKRNGPSIGPSLTLDRMAEDGIELAEYLRKHLGKQKIILVCHSFGSVLGLRMIKKRPELFYAYVGTGQVADEIRNYSATYEGLLKKARALGNQEAVAELSRIGPPPYASGEGYRVQWKWANRFEGADEFLYGTLGLKLVAPGYSLADISADDEGEMLSGERLVPQLHSSGPKELGLEFSIPFFIFQGEEDFTTATALARQYYAMIKAPRKAFVAIPDAGHFAVFMHSRQFLSELVRRVRPLADGR